MATRSQITRISPALLDRIDRLNGCGGRWIVDVSEVPGRWWGTADEQEPGCPLPLPHCERLGGLGWFDAQSASTVTGYKVNSPELAAFYCAITGWRARLIFTADRLNADCSYGYDSPSIYRSNNRVFRDEYSVELEDAETSHDGLALDVRFCTLEMVQAIESLEQYPILCEDDHSTLELELQEEAWERDIAQEWRSAVEQALQEYAPEGYHPYWAEERLETVEAAKGEQALAAELRELFHACADASNTYWQEESGSQWIDVARVASAIDRADLVELTGLALLPPDQEWRREPYPWPGAEPSPLAPALPV